MAFKLPKSIGTLFGFEEHLSEWGRPVKERDLDPGIAAEADREGITYIDPSVPEKDRPTSVEHEDVHHDQMRRGDLDYTHDTVTWKGKTVARQSITEGGHNLPWEKEAYAKVPKSKK